ncbi:MAG TPA: hypothetical protein VGQ71_04815 [Terriglobales bacterium]|jgi:hypothetical protein|nr:hypothetical protein [Terriglobales bacterium]
MRNVLEVLREKESQAKKLAEEIEALRLAGRIMSESDGDPLAEQPVSKPHSQAANVVDMAKKRSWP